MAESPDQTRAAMTVVTAAAAAEVRSVAEQAGSSAPDVRAALFAATPLIVGAYSEGTGALALDWYEQLREEARPRQPFRPRLVSVLDEESIAADVAYATQLLHEIEVGGRELDLALERAVDESVSLLGSIVERKVANGFRDTITTNSTEDPAAGGWKRHAQPDACKFCLMLADRGAVFTEKTARFAAHTNCFCIAGPEFGGKELWAEATPMQYVASQRNRSEKEQLALRKYLNTNFPDAPG